MYAMPGGGGLVTRGVEERRVKISCALWEEGGRWGMNESRPGGN